MITDFSPIWISLKIAGLATVATFFSGIGAAYWMLGYRGRWKSLLEGIFISPLILPPTVVGFLLLVLLGRNGWLGQLMAQFDFTVVFTWYAAVITATVVSFPLMYKTALGAFEQVDASLLAVAQTLGASRGRIFREILLPLSLPGILAGTVLSFARALGEFGATLMLAGNIPGQTQTMPMAIFFAVEAGAMTEAWLWTAAIMTVSLTAIGIVNLWQRNYERKIRIGTIEADVPQNFASKQSGDDLSSSDRGLWVDIEKRLGNFTLNTTFWAHQETLGILGGSGSGKTMTLKCIAGVETPTVGRIVLNGQVLFDSEQGINVPPDRRKVSLVFQNYGLFPHMTVGQNIAFGLQNLSRQERNQRLHHYLTAMELAEWSGRYPHQLSGGQQQRVALARALATEPQALLLDEPFSALDTYLRSQLEQKLIHTLSNYGGVALFVSHNLEEVYRVCTNMLVMSGGRPIGFDHKYQIFDYPASVRVAQLTGCKNFSPATAVDNNTIEAIAWGVTLQIIAGLPSALSAVGIRAHHLQLHTAPRPGMDNTFPCWLAATSETPHRITLFLKLNGEPQSRQDYQIQAEMFKERWQTIKDHPLPWYVHLDPLRLMPLVG